jgi:hypothetical protein
VLSLEALHGGARSSVCALVVDGDSEVKQGLADLERSDYVKFHGLIRQLAEAGFIRNEQKFRRLEADIYELKLSHPALRMFCFRHGDLWICTHIDRKPGKRRLQDHVVKVRALRERLLMEGVHEDESC